MKIVVATVVYPDAVKYFKDFIWSLQTQTFRDFSVLILTDKVKKQEIFKRLAFSDIYADVIENFMQLTPQALRVKLIQKSKESGADLLVFGDADDTFSEGRIQEIVDCFRTTSADFFFNDILIDGCEGTSFQMPDSANSIEILANSNFLGLSNTALRLDSIDEQFISSLFDCDTFVFDWYMYSRLLIMGLRGIHTGQTAFTRYRIHNNNFAGVPVKTGCNLRKEIDVKRSHYRLLSKYDERFVRYYEAYLEGRIKIKKKPGGFWWNLTVPDLNNNEFDV